MEFSDNLLNMNWSDYSNQNIERMKEGSKEIENYYLRFNSMMNEGEYINISKKNSSYNIETFFLERQILEFDTNIDYKPSNGFWMSYGMKQHNNDRGWLDWTLSEMPKWILPWENDVYAIKLINDDQKIYRIDSYEKMNQFTNKYGVEEKINWKKVKDDGYYGISISKFRRIILSSIWYNFFDCSSQVVWDYRAIESVRKLS